MARDRLELLMSHLMDEIASQPEIWSTAIDLAAAPSTTAALPAPGQRVGVVGCGSSLNVARCYARLRESAGHGQTDAYPASELIATRHYDHMVLISRTGTTSEVLAALREIPQGVRTTALTADEDAALAHETSSAVLLDFADERSVVSSRFITATIVLLRASLGEDLSGLPREAERALASPLAPELAERKEFTFLGRGWAAFAADEAALKLREASQTWAESYPAMEYRHGPISVSDPGTVTWAIGEIPDALAADAAHTGATVINQGGDPLASLIGAQRMAVMLAARKGIDPDQPRSLSRSVILA
jgi:fructoselysine-6-P-deglycase FrlB-like protein